MIALHYTIQFLSYWQIGSGKGSGNLSDASILKDANGLPYLPGKTIKGLLLDAVKDNHVDAATQRAIFGEENGQTVTTIFESAVLDTPIKTALLQSPQLIPGLYEIKTFIRLDESKQAVHGALRTKEACLPLTLVGTIQCTDEAAKATLQASFPFLKHAGLKRNRGFGRCRIAAKAS